jgi:hypothetical protein
MPTGRRLFRLLLVALTAKVGSLDCAPPIVSVRRDARAGAGFIKEGLKHHLEPIIPERTSIFSYSVLPGTRCEFYELQGHRVHTVTQTCWLRFIIEDMPKMGIAKSA